MISLEELEQCLTYNNVDYITECLCNNEISSTYYSRILIWAASKAHLVVVNIILQHENIDHKKISSHALRVASANGHYNIVDRLLQDERANPSVRNNYAVVIASTNGHCKIVDRLLQDERADPSGRKNDAIKMSSKNGHLNVVIRLLQDERVDASVDDNRPIRYSVQNGHYEVSYILARAQWPNGIKDIPQDLKGYIHAIRQGEIIYNTRKDSVKDAAHLFRWLQKGYIPTSIKDLYLPSSMSTRQLYETKEMPFDVMNIVNEYAGTQINIDTSRPSVEELTMISIRGFNLVRKSSLIMNHLEKVRIEREESEHSCNEQALIPYGRLVFN